MKEKIIVFGFNSLVILSWIELDHITERDKPLFQYYQSVWQHWGMLTLKDLCFMMTGLVTWTQHTSLSSFLLLTFIFFSTEKLKANKQEGEASQSALTSDPISLLTLWSPAAKSSWTCYTSLCIMYQRRKTLWRYVGGSCCCSLVKSTLLHLILCERAAREQLQQKICKVEL